MSEAVYGLPPAALARTGEAATQVSPLVVGAEAIEDLADGALSRFVVLAPPGALERRYVLAQALRSLKPGGDLLALAPKKLGGTRLGAELAAFGCDVVEDARRHHRICRSPRPTAPTGVTAAIAAGGPQFVERLALWSQPGVFAWDRLDPGSALLIAQTWTPAGVGADLGCGAGALARAALKSADVTGLTLIDIDRRAINAARRNIDDPRAVFLQADLRAPAALTGLDFALLNPPFHDGGAEDRTLGQAMVRTAAAMLRRGGVLRMVSNVALPYEATLVALFREARLLVREAGYKVLEAVK